MVTSTELCNAVNTAHEYWNAEFFQKVTKITEKQADNAMQTIKQFKDNGQQLYDKEFWNLGQADSICAVAGPVHTQMNMIEYYITALTGAS